MGCGKKTARARGADIGTICRTSGCERRGPMKRWFLAERIGSTRFGLGSDVIVNLKNIPARDARGYHAHVVGLRVNGTMRFTTGATNPVISRTQMLGGVFKNIFLEDESGHQYIAGNFDARNVWDHHFFRNLMPDMWAMVVDDLGANLGAVNSDRFVTLNLELVRMDKRGGGWEGAILLAALQQRDGAFRFTIGTATGIPGNPANTTLGGFQGPSVDVWVEVVYLEHPFVTRAYQIETYTHDEPTGASRHPEREHEFFVLRHHEEETGAQGVSDYGALNASVAGDQIVRGLSQQELEDRDQMILLEDPLGAILNIEGGFMAALPYVVSNVAQAQMIVPAARHDKARPAGAIEFAYASRSTHTTTRFLHRSILCHEPERIATFARLAGCDPVDVDPVGVTCTGRPCPPSRDVDLMLVRGL